jgi:hypothetical protein
MYGTNFYSWVLNFTPGDNATNAKFTTTYNARVGYLKCFSKVGENIFVFEKALGYYVCSFYILSSTKTGKKLSACNPGLPDVLFSKYQLG